MTDKTDALVALADELAAAWNTAKEFDMDEFADRIRALAAQPAGGVGLERFRLPVEAWQSSLDPDDDDEADAFTEADNLLALIDSAGGAKGATDECGKSRGTYEGEGPADADDMRAALTAALAETASQIEKLTQEVEGLRAEVAAWSKSYDRAVDLGQQHRDRAERMAEALRAFPAEPNPYTYRIAHAKARAALANGESASA